MSSNVSREAPQSRGAELRAPTPEEEVERARQAQLIVESPVFREAMSYLVESVMGEMRACAPGDTDAHTVLVMRYRLVAKFEDWFHQLIRTGRLAELQQEANHG